MATPIAGPPRHPLALLTADEISASTNAVRATFGAMRESKALRWIDVSLEEPGAPAERAALLADSDARALGSLSRRVRVVVYDATDNKTYEALVALLHRRYPAGANEAEATATSTSTSTSTNSTYVEARITSGGGKPCHVPGVQPAMTLEEYELVEDLCRARVRRCKGPR